MALLQVYMGIWTPHYIKENYSCHSLILVTVGYQWLSLVIIGYCWFFLVIVGYQWSQLVISVYRW